MTPISDPSHLLNPLATSMQLEWSASQLDGVPKELEDSIRYETSRLVQAAGVLLRLPQEIIGQAIVTLFRFWTTPDGGSLLEHDSKVGQMVSRLLRFPEQTMHHPRKLGRPRRVNLLRCYVTLENKEANVPGAQVVATASLYLTAKPSAYPVSSRQVITTVEYLCSLKPEQLVSATAESKLDITWTLSEGQYELLRDRLYSVESHMLRVLGFQTHTALPYTLCINYLQTLDVFQSSDGTNLAKRTFALLNSALLSPQNVYLTHPPASLATAAIYLAAREIGFKLPEVEWWEVFDVDREELGFLVVALRSLEGFALEQKRKWEAKHVPFTVDALQTEVKQTLK